MTTPTDTSAPQAARTGLLERYRRSRDAEVAYWRDAMSAPPPKHRSRRVRRTLAGIVIGCELLAVVALFTPSSDVQVLASGFAFFVGTMAAIPLAVAVRDILPRANGRIGMFQRRAQAPDERLQAAWDRACRQVLTSIIAVGMIGGLVAVVTTYLTGDFAITITPARVNAGVLAALLLGLVPVAVLACSDQAEAPDSDAVRFTGPAVVPAPPAAGRLYRLLIGLLTIAPLFVFMALTTYQQSRSWTVALSSAAVFAIAIGLLMPWLLRRLYARRRNQVVDPPTPLASAPQP